MVTLDTVEQPGRVLMVIIAELVTLTIFLVQFRQPPVSLMTWIYSS